MTAKIGHTQASNKWGVVCKTETLRVNYGDYNCMSKRGFKNVRGLQLYVQKGEFKNVK